MHIAEKKRDLWMYQNEKEEAKRLQGVRELRQDEEIAWGPPRNLTKWPDWEEARKLEERKVIRVESEETQDYVKGRKEYGIRGRETEDLHTERGGAFR